MKAEKINRVLTIFTATVLLMTGQSYAGPIDDPETQPVTLHVLVDFIENAEQGDDAGGNLAQFGQEEDPTDANKEAIIGTFEIRENEGRTGTDRGIFLSTAADGFGVDQGEDFIGFTKDVSTITLDDGTTTAKIDASQFTAISYFIKTANVDATAEVSVKLELKIGDGGGGESSPGAGDGNGGSVWSQKVAISYADLTATYIRNVLDLNLSEFELSVGPGNGNAFPTNFGDTDANLSNVSAINFVMSADTTAEKALDSVVRSIVVDDINLFDNPKIEVTYVDKVFGKSATSSTSDDGATYQFKAVVSGFDPTNPAPDLKVSTDGTGTLTDVVIPANTAPSMIVISPNASGVIQFTYKASEVSEMAGITVDLAP